jgi:Zn-dependent protease with chaperone function
VFCDQCGRPAPAGTWVCPHCGAPLAAAVPVPTAVTTAAVIPGSRQPEVPLSVPVAAVPAPPWPDPQPAAGRLLGRYPKAGEMPQGPGARVWWGAMFGRNRRGTVAGIIAAWFNVPFVVLMGGVGGVFGGLAGTVNGTVAGVAVTHRIDALLTWVFPLPVGVHDLLPTPGAQIGGIVGGILGAVNGAFTLAWMALDWPWEALYRGDPNWPWEVAFGQVVTALFVGGLYLGWRVLMEGSRLAVAGARPMSRREAEWLMPILYEAAQRLGLRALPRVLIDDRREPNSHAGIRTVTINYGLLEQLNYDREAIGAVLAHELVHWRDGDAIGMVWARGVALPLYLLYELASRMLRSARARPVQFTIRMLLWPVLVTVRYGVIPLQARVWRDLEYRADAIVAAAGYRKGLRTALTYIRRSFDGSRSGWDTAINATHPPNELRLDALEEPGRSYPLREDHPLVRALPGWTSDSTVQKGW